MTECLGALGVAIRPDRDTLTVEGSGGRLRAPSYALDTRASGTTARFLTAAVTLADAAVVVDGSAQLRRRPFGDLVDGLGALGGRVEELGEPGALPLRVHPGRLRGGSAVIEAGTSSQFVSALAMIGPFANRDLELSFAGGILTSRPYVETTVEVMEAFGAQADLGPTSLRVEATGGYRARRFLIEADASAAVYPLVGAAITGGKVLVRGVRQQSTQADLAVVEVLARMGCSVRWDEDGVSLEAPAGRLTGIDVDMNQMPDAAVAVAVAAAFADGPTRITNVGNLRVKESDRLAAVENELRKLGAGVETGEDWLRVHPAPLRGAEIDTYEDHRIAMAFALAGLVVPGVVIKDPGCVVKTWPGFFEDLENLRSRSALPGGRSVAREEPARPSVIVAVDGPGGAGKSTVSRGLAVRLGIPHLDTGAFYRAAALAVLGAGIDPGRPEEVTNAVSEAAIDYRAGATILDGADVEDAIRRPEVTAAASAVSAIPEVRAVMVDQQRRWVEQHGGSAVVEGRDIGTVVFPDATLKVFLTARPEVRAARRAREIPDAEVDEVAEKLARRDHFDSTRAASPLQRAPDALEIDTSDLSIEEVIETIARMLPVD